MSRLKITQIVIPDYDTYAVIHLQGGSAFGASKEWCDVQHPAVGDYVIDTDWSSPGTPGYTYRRKVEKAASE